MTPDDVAKIGLYILGSVGGAGVVIVGLSSWLGNVWANWIMAKERAKHDAELTALRVKLESEVSILKEHYLRGFNDKLVAYRMVIDLVSEVLGDLDAARNTSRTLSPERKDATNRLRLKIYGYLAMMAPQNVMDAQDNLMDYLIEVINGKSNYDFGKTRSLAISLLNEMRKDIKIDVSPISYHGGL